MEKMLCIEPTVLNAVTALQEPREYFVEVLPAGDCRSCWFEILAEFCWQNLVDGGGTWVVAGESEKIAKFSHIDF